MAAGGNLSTTLAVLMSFSYLLLFYKKNIKKYTEKSDDVVQMDIESNKKITFFDIPLYGNFGYNGLNRMKDKIDNMHNTYIFVLDNENRQYVNVLNDYVREKYPLIEKIEDMEIYYIK